MIDHEARAKEVIEKVRACLTPIWLGMRQRDALETEIAKVCRAVERETIERCSKVAENGRFLTDTSMEAQWGTACAAAIRREQGA